MNNFNLGQSWIDTLMLNGLAFPSSTIITGPGGAGKPLIGAIIADAWLKQGGTLIHLLINFDRAYADKMLEIFNKDLKKYADQIVYVEFDPLINGLEKQGLNTLRTNLLKPENLDLAIQAAQVILPKSDKGLLLYGSALNMLLFSKTYGQAIQQKILSLLKNGENCLFSVADNMFKEQISELENAADNLFYSHDLGKMNLAFKILRMKNNTYKKDEVSVPLTENELLSIRAEANKARKHLIPVIKTI